MPQLRVKWHHVFAVYFTLAAVCLITAIFTAPPIQSVLFIIGGTFIAAFIPLIMLIYFMRGLLRVT